MLHKYLLLLLLLLLCRNEWRVLNKTLEKILIDSLWRGQWNYTSKLSEMTALKLVSLSRTSLPISATLSTSSGIANGQLRFNELYPEYLTFFHPTAAPLNLQVRQQQPQTLSHSVWTLGVALGSYFSLTAQSICKQAFVALFSQ